MKFDPAATGSDGTVAHAAPQIIPALAAILLGTVFLLGTGFVPVEAVHNAAHDTRHAFAFPCH